MKTLFKKCVLVIVVAFMSWCSVNVLADDVHILASTENETAGPIVCILSFSDPGGVNVKVSSKTVNPGDATLLACTVDLDELKNDQEYEIKVQKGDGAALSTVVVKKNDDMWVAIDQKVDDVHVDAGDWPDNINVYF